MSPYRSNPFFSTASTFFLPSVGDKVDNAVAQGKDLARDAQNKGQELLGKADNKVQDAKEAVKTAAKPSPTGLDLYARYVLWHVLCLYHECVLLKMDGEWSLIPGSHLLVLLVVPLPTVP
jgi:hypothetical protein